MAFAYEKALGAGKLRRRARTSRFSGLPEVHLAASQVRREPEEGPEEVIDDGAVDSGSGAW